MADSKNTSDNQSQVESVRASLRELIAETLGVDSSKIVDEASFVDDLNADSLDIVELVMAIEKEFNIEIADDDAEKINTVADALDFILSAKA